SDLPAVGQTGSQSKGRSARLKGGLNGLRKVRPPCGRADRVAIETPVCPTERRSERNSEWSDLPAVGQTGSQSKGRSARLKGGLNGIRNGQTSLRSGRPGRNRNAGLPD